MPNRSPKRSWSKPRPYASFFSGALGLDLGFEAAGGYQCVSLNEIDPVACATIRENRHAIFPATQPKLYDCDIRLLSAEKLLRDLKLEVGELFAVIGGPPCQAFSTAGKRLGLNDDRGNVFLHFIHLVGQLKPKYVVMENVRGLLSSPLAHRPHNERGEDYPRLSDDERPGGALRKILGLLNDYGYNVSFNLYNTANFGVPQTRERLVFLASRESEDIPFLKPTHPEEQWVTLRDAIAFLQQRHHESSRFPDGRLEYYRLLKEGQNWKDLPLTKQRDAMGASWFSGGGKTGFFRRLAWNKPSPTLVTSPTMPATDLCHPSELRPLSVEEYAAIQTFPADFVLQGRTADKYRQLGNAVPVAFARAIAEHVKNFDDRLLEPIEPSRSRFSRYVRTDHLSWEQRSLVLFNEL